MYFAHTLTRYLLNLEEKDPLEVHNVDYREHLPVSEQRFTKFQKATERDETTEMLNGVVKIGWYETKADVEPEYIFLFERN